MKKTLYFTNDISLVDKKYTDAILVENSAFIGSLFSLKKKDPKKTLKSSLKKRLEQNLPTIINSKDLSTDDLREMKRMALEYGYHSVTRRPKDIKIDIPTIDPSIELDVIGDIHGLYDNLICLMNDLGYDLEGNHKDNRKLLFLGDLIDRGPDSVKVLELVMKLQKNGHFIIAGNHEDRLRENLKNRDRKGGKSGLDTLDEIKILEHKEEILKFLESLPYYYIQNDFLFCHADIEYFNPFKTPYLDLIYGTGYKYSSISTEDEKYQELYDNGINKYTLIHGHKKGNNIYKNVFSLEFEQTYNGHIGALNMTKVKETGCFNSALTLEKCDFKFKK